MVNAELYSCYKKIAFDHHVEDPLDPHIDLVVLVDNTLPEGKEDKA